MSTCIMVRKTDRMSSNEFSAPLYSALDEISKLENTFRRTERTPAGFGIDGVAESVQLEQIQTSMNSLIDHLRDHGNTNKEFEEQAKELSAFIPELDHARKRGKRTKQMLLGTSNGENDDDDKSVDEDVPVYDETSLTFSSDEKIKHPGKCMNYQTVRWIEKHHGRRIRSQTVLEEEDLESLRRMFNQLDNDGGGTVDLEEIDAGIRLLNLFNPMAKIPRESIMQKMSTVDEDGSGEIDFQEFVSAMSSGWGGNSHFYRLSDEKENGSETLSFFEFAVAFGREKSLQDVYEVNDATWAAIKFFHELFSIKMVTAHQKENETNEDIQNPAGKKSNAVERESAYERAKRHHRLQMQVEKRRCNEAARAIAAEKKRSQGFDLVQSGRETLVERAQQKCDGDLMEVLAKHENLQKYMRGADSSIVGSFLGEVDSHHPRSLITEKSSVKHFRYNDALSNVSMQSNASINRGAASLGVPGWINLETIECKVPQSVPKEGDEKNNESCLSSLHSENTKLSPEVKSMVLDFKKNSEKPVKCNIVRQKMARFIAQQCRNKSTNESIFAAIPKNVASDTVKSKSSLGKGGQNCVHDKSSEKLYRIPRPPQGSTARFKRRSCTSARHLSPGSFSPRSPRSHQSRQLGPNAHPRQSILIDSGSVMSELTVVPRQASVRLQRTPVPESGNSQTKGYTYSSDPTHGNWKGASKNAVYPRSRKCLQHHVRTFRNALNHAKETIVQRQRQPLSKVRRQSKEETTGHLPRKPKRNISGKTASEPRVFQAFPPRFLTRHPMKESNINNYISETEDHPIEIFNRIEGRPTEFQPLDRGPAASLDITVGHSLDGSLVHLSEDEYMDTNEQCVVVINPSLSSVSGSSMSPSLSPSRHKSDSAKVQN